ncbi:hypothetical protein GQ53DRAFT_812386 [Thozetella sp. PMI_491]|nr:hypothetical protein GQ53DRAFT_812386 [Thozetella sp. PMI_491]
MAYTVENAQPEDIDELAKAIISGLPPQLLKIQGADKNAEKLVAAVSRGLESSIANPNHLVIVAREQGTGTAVSLADWVLPAEDMKVPKTEEEMKEEIEKRRKALPPGRNEAFMVDNLTQMLTMTRIALNGRRCYHLASLVTLEAYRGKGLATKLVQWPLKQADNEGEIAFLTTDDIGPARKIYERAGFLVAGEINLDFEKYGSSGSLKRVGMLREPRRAES